ncbi:hypothetical protein V3C99_009026 [Haemonchus contortus]
METGALLEQIGSIESPKDQDQSYEDRLGVESDSWEGSSSPLSPIKKKKNKRRTASKKTSSSTVRAPRKRRAPADAYTTSVNVSSLPRRSSNRLRKKQVEQKDFSKLPPKYAGPPSPSLRFCDYVINELLNSKYEPINWLIELPTVKKKLNHRQYANAEEFANEIRTLCMNPIDAALTDECLSLLRTFDKLWLYLPPDPEERSPTFMNVLDVEQADASYPSTYPAEPIERKNAQRLHTDVHASILGNVKNKQIVVKKTGEKALMAQHPSYANPDDCVPVALPHHGHLEMGDKQVVKPTHEDDKEAEQVNHGTVTIDSLRDIENDEPCASLTHKEMVRLAQDLQCLSEEEMAEIIEIILKYHVVEVPEGNEEFIAIPFDSLTSGSLHEIHERVAAISNNKQGDELRIDGPSRYDVLKESSVAQASVGPKCRKTRQRNASKYSQPAKRRANIVDVEARKRELVEGIKKLGGTGTTRPMRKQNAYASDGARVRSSYVFDSSSESSSSSSESWESTGNSESSSD